MDLPPTAAKDRLKFGPILGPGQPRKVSAANAANTLLDPTRLDLSPRLLFAFGRASLDSNGWPAAAAIK
jgi:hypothetical protein